jgi:hypothetical protein
MKKPWKRLLTWSLCLSMLLSYGALAADMMPMDGMDPPPDGDMGGGAPPGDNAPETAAIVITDGAENTDAEYEPGAYSSYLSNVDGVLTIDGLDLTSGDYTFNGLVATGPDSVVRLQKCTIRLGVDSPATDDDTGGAATNIDNGATLYISDSELVVDGAARYVTANYNDAKLIVNNSTVTSTGSNDNTADVSDPFSNEALLISGTARANFSIGATQTYYYDSVCTAEGWAALSTDSATGNGLDLYAYNTEGIAENGGYSTYADTNCRVWLYGSRLTAAEIGCIISKNGQIHSYGSDSAPDDVMQYHEGKEVSVDSSIVGGRNAVMIHAPDMMGQGLMAADCGTFYAENTTLATDNDLRSTKDYNDYGEAVGAYIDDVSGDIFLIRSTSADIQLKNVTMDSYNGVLVHTVLNADSMGNFLAAGDGEQVNPVAVTMEDMDVTGDILHEDYQRQMTVDLEHTTLTGNLVSGTMDSWNQQWTNYGEVNWVVDDSFDADYGIALTVGDGAVWNVTGDSSLKSLTVMEGGTVQGDITLDGEPLTPEPGETYTGDIQVTGSIPEEEPESLVESAVETVAAPEAPEEEAPAAEEPAPEASPEPVVETTSQNSGSTVVAIVLAVVALAIIAAAVVVRKKKK